MAIIIKTKEEIEIISESCKRLAYVLGEVSKKVKIGISTKELDDYAFSLIKKLGDEPAFLNYKPKGAREAFPSTLCVSVNNEVVHGIPKEDKILKEGDIVSIDCGIKHKGMFSDMALTLPVGKISKEDSLLLDITKKALHIGIKEAKIGNRVGDIGYVIEKFIRKQKHKYGIVDILSGHGVGKYIHEDPYIPNFGKKGTGDILVEGMVVAIEPMVNLGSKNIFLDKDNWTFKTIDNKKSAHFEHTILITKNGGKILTSI